MESTAADKDEKNPSTPPESLEKMDREALLEVSSAIIRDLHRRVTSQRFKARAHDRDRLSHVRALISVLQAHSAILRDVELDELKARLEKLENRKL